MGSSFGWGLWWSSVARPFTYPYAELVSLGQTIKLLFLRLLATTVVKHG